MKNSIKLGDVDFFPRSQNTKFELSSEATKDELLQIVRALSKAMSSDKNNVCYILGMGSRPKSIYKKIAKINGVQLIRYRSVLSNFYAFVFPFIAGFEGVVKVKEFDALPYVFDLISESSMAAIYCFSRKYEELVLASILAAPRGKTYKNSLKDDPSYVMLLVDTDSFESATGIMKIISYGFAAPRHLTSLFGN